MSPWSYHRIKTVKSFDELVHTRFGDSVNALCWPRTLAGDFEEVVQHVTASSEDITSLDEATLRNFALSAAGRAAVNTLVDDLQLLGGQGLSPVLDCIARYPIDEAHPLVPTDVYSFHADRAPVEADTYLCSYTEASSEGLPNEFAQRYIDGPEIRLALLKEFGGADDETFTEYLRDQCYDLHYRAIKEVAPYAFGLGNLWRIAIAYPGCPVPPCVHRAPTTAPGRPPRLLLIS